MSLALWLRAGRTQRGMSVEDVSRVTKIQARILERIESGKPEGLPADVFVRGFVRSFAKCVGLDEGEALRRYGVCSGSIGVAPVVTATATARAMVDAMADLAPAAARTAPRMLREQPRPEIVDVADPVSLASGSLQDMPRVAAPEAVIAAAVDETPRPIYVERPEPFAEAVVEVAGVATEEPAKKKRGRRGGKGRNKRKAIATGTPAEASPIVDQPSPVAAVEVAEAAPAIEVIEVIEVLEAAPAIVEPAEGTFEEPIATATWRPKMPPAATQSVPPWRRPHTSPPVPSLVIDDADPDRAEQELEERAAAQSAETSVQRRSFLPPILLDREDRSARQGGLTLAVILLLIAATITLSYLMRRPSSSGDGVTQLAAPAQSIG